MAGIELRCGSSLHGVLIDDKTLEVKCRRRKCGSEPGVVVLHRFDLRSGRLISTNLYRDPITKEVTKTNGTSSQLAGVRSA
jgi:hypothetical protein